jgi:phthalate 3,4-dioxygenase beta subunit
MSGYLPALPFDDPRHLAAHHFLVEEAAILDDGDWARWLGLLTDDVRYVMPVTVTMVHDAIDRDTGMAHFDEDRYAIEKRVQRLLTDHAWTEDPRSRTRHLVTNVRTLDGADGDRIDVESTVLLFRSRGDDRAPEWVCAQRRDVLRREPDGALRLADRHITVEESVLRTQNLAIFL